MGQFTDVRSTTAFGRTGHWSRHRPTAGFDPFLPFSGLFCCDAQRSFAGEARRNRDNISAVDKPPPEQPPSRSPEEQAILVIAGLWRAIPFI
jgi:hypothetical protein